MSSLFFTPWTTNESVAPALAIAAAEKLPPTTVGEQMWTGFLVTASIFLAAALLELVARRLEFLAQRGRGRVPLRPPRVLARGAPGVAVSNNCRVVLPQRDRVAMHGRDLRLQ